MYKAQWVIFDRSYFGAMFSIRREMIFTRAKTFWGFSANLLFPLCAEFKRFRVRKRRRSETLGYVWSAMQHHWNPRVSVVFIIILLSSWTISFTLQSRQSPGTRGPAFVFWCTRIYVTISVKLIMIRITYLLQQVYKSTFAQMEQKNLYFISLMQLNFKND